MRWHDVRRLTASSAEALSTCTPEEILRVCEEADYIEIKAAYKRLARAYHPDVADPFLRRRNEEILKVINRAYEELLRSRGC
jgi:curved DNA-binding protein CbpA